MNYHKYNSIYYSEPIKKMAGYLELERANVNWELSIDERDLPHDDWKAFR